MEIKLDEKNNRAVALDDGKEIGECTFVERDGVFIINHTLVQPAYGGQGIAKKLVEKVVENARDKNIKLQATCSYARKLFSSTEEYDDVVEK